MNIDRKLFQSGTNDEGGPVDKMMGPRAEYSAGGEQGNAPEGGSPGEGTGSIAGKIIYLNFSGNVVHGETASTAWEAIQRCLQAGRQVLVLDLRDVDKMDAAGLGVLASGHLAAQGAGMELRLVNTPAIVQKLLTITRLDTLLRWAPIEVFEGKGFQRSQET